MNHLLAQYNRDSITSTQMIREMITFCEINFSVLKKIQKEQVEWAKSNFGDKPSWMPLLGAMEELGELSHAHLKNEQKIRMNEPHFENKKDAVADIIIYLCDYCTSQNIDIQSVLQDTWDNVKKRNWNKNKIDGNADRQ